MPPSSVSHPSNPASEAVGSWQRVGNTDTLSFQGQHLWPGARGDRPCVLGYICLGWSYYCAELREEKHGGRGWGGMSGFKYHRLTLAFLTDSIFFNKCFFICCALRSISGEPLLTFLMGLTEGRSAEAFTMAIPEVEASWVLKY